MSFQIHASSLVRYEASPKGTFPKKGYTYWDFESQAQTTAVDVESGSAAGAACSTCQSGSAAGRGQGHLSVGIERALQSTQ